MKGIRLVFLTGISFLFSLAVSINLFALFLHHCRYPRKTSARQMVRTFPRSLLVLLRQGGGRPV